jgi:hypothetical protein
MGLAPGRRSHVRPCRTCQRDVGGPLISLNALAGHRSTPRRLRRPTYEADTGHGTGFRRLSGGRDVASPGDWASGNPAFAISRGSLSAPPRTPGHGRWFPGMLLSPLAFRPQVSHQTQEPPSKFLPAELGIQQGASRRTTSRRRATCRRASAGRIGRRRPAAG